MAEALSFDELFAQGAGRPAPDSVVRLYQLAFAQFGVQSLWYSRRLAHPTIRQALGVAEGLRREGSMRSRPLAEQIERACRAAL